jgi:hypothetical protein
MNEAGSPALHMVWDDAIVPAVTSLIVTVNVLDIAEQATVLSVLVTILL